MQISSRFTIAIHIFACIDTFQKDRKVTSDFIASSVNVNPVIIRKILSSLKKSGLIHVQRGTGGGTEIAKPLDQINLNDIFQSVECIDDGILFHFHENPNMNCPVGKNIHNILDDKLLQIQKVLEAEMSSITLKDIIDDARRCIESNP